MKDPTRVLYLPNPVPHLSRYQEHVHNWIMQSLARWSGRQEPRAEVQATVDTPATDQTQARAVRVAENIRHCLEMLAAAPQDLVVVSPDVAAPGLDLVVALGVELGVEVRIVGWWWHGYLTGPNRLLTDHRYASLVSADAVGVGSSAAYALEDVVGEIHRMVRVGLPWNRLVSGGRRRDQDGSGRTVVCTHTANDDYVHAGKIFRAVAGAAAGRDAASRWIYLTDRQDVVDEQQQLFRGSPVKVVLRGTTAGYLDQLAECDVWWQASGLSAPWDYGLVEAAALNLSIVAPAEGFWKEMLERDGKITPYQPTENAGGLEVLEATLHRTPGERAYAAETLGDDPDHAGALLDFLDVTSAADRREDGEAAPDD